MAEAKFTDIPDAFAAPPKYKATFKDNKGREESVYVAISNDETSVPAEDRAERVKRRLLETRGDWFNRGVTAETLTVVAAGTQSPKEQARIAGALSAGDVPVVPAKK